MRPRTLEQFIGQTHLLAPDRVLRRAIESDQLFSMILWGPPGVGKTSLARIIAESTDSEFEAMSAVTAGVGDVRKLIARACAAPDRRTILFIDEIHRFNKAQQDALLHSVEDGTLILIGATTENPSFEVISPLLSRCRVFTLNPLSLEEMDAILNRALSDEHGLGGKGPPLSTEARSVLLELSAGDARNLLNALEIACQLVRNRDSASIERQNVEEAMQRRSPLYDKSGDRHYDTISAYIKSVRGSDPDAAVYWLAQMLEGGEEPRFIARRLIILASEDVGNADPHALMLAASAFEAVNVIGMPEARIVLAQATVYLASAPKSNASYLAIESASREIQNNGAGAVPLHLRNAPTRLMREQDYGAGYKYPPDFGGFVQQDYFPANFGARVYYHPTENGVEKRIRERLAQLWPKRKR